MTRLPLQAFDKNRIWLELAHLVYELLAWTQLLAWTDQAAPTWQPKQRLRLLTVAARVITTGRRRISRPSSRSACGTSRSAR